MELQKQSIIIGAPSAFGQELPGVESAPDALRRTGLADKIKALGFRVEDAGNVEIPVGVATRKAGERLMSPEECSLACKKIHDTVHKYARDRENFVTIIGGDHSIALGSISGVMKARPDTCVIWVDAHADINTPETSGSGHIHGMPVAGLVGEFDAKSVPGLSWLEPCLRPDSIVFIGLRDVDEGEKKILKKLNIKAFSMTEVDRLGMPEVVKQALDHVNPQRDRPIHLSFDIDGIDPYYAPSTGTKVMGGLTVRESRYLIEELVATGKLKSMDLVEINPKESPETIRCDIGGYLGGEVNKTVALGVDLILTAHGKSLL